MSASFTRSVHPFRLGVFSSWVVPVIATAAISAMLSGAVAWIAFQSTTGFAAHATIAGNQAEITALQNQQRSVDAQLSGFGGQYVSMGAFAEFKARYEKDQAEEHDFRVRIDAKMDMLLSARNGAGVP